MSKDMVPFNEQGGNEQDDNNHGYWEYRGSFVNTGNFVNGNKEGYWEWFSSYGDIIAKEFFLT